VEPTVRQHPSRRANDQTWMSCLRERGQLLEQLPALEHRRSHLLEKSAQRSGVSHHLLDRAYDLACEEGLDPALALELVGCGVAVIELAPTEPLAEAHSLNPEFVAQVTEPLPDILRERRMRLTFRRMRSALEQTETLEEAIQRFGSEPDVGEFDYASGV
jgi:hypothetical protein